MERRKEALCPLNINFSICCFCVHENSLPAMLSPMLSLCIKRNPRVSGDGDSGREKELSLHIHHVEE